MEADLVAARSVAGFEFVLLRTGTALVRGEQDRFAPGAFRAFLSQLEAASVETGVPVKQGAYYLPTMKSLNNPFDIATGAASYARRHAELLAVYVVAPQRGLVAVLLDACVRSIPGLDIRLLLDPNDAVPLLRARDRALPQDWWELPRTTKKT